MTLAEKEFAKNWIKELDGGLLKQFPSDFILDTETETIEMPKIRLLLGPELFGNFEIVDFNGNLFLNASTIEKAKFILYSNRTKPNSVNIPVDEEEIKNLVRLYEQHLDNILRGLEKEFKNTFPDSKNFFETSNLIFVSLNLTRY